MSRLIDADELKKQAYKSGDWDKPLVVDVADIDETPTVDPWHYPSKGELPTEQNYYLVAVKPNFEGADEFVTLYTYLPTEERWIDKWGYTNREVYAWMPLPEPPKERA